MEKQNKVSLEELAKKGYPIIFDTSALITFNKRKIPKDINRQFIIVREYYDSISKIKKCVKRGSNFYLPHLISEEFQKRRDNSFDRMDYWLLELYRKINRCKEEKDLVNTFRCHNKIFNLNEKDSYDIQKNLYSVLSERYIKLKRGYNLSDDDYDCLITVITFAKKGSVALICNDTGIINARKDIITNEHLSSEKVKCFIRFGIDNFEEVGFYYI